MAKRETVYLLNLKNRLGENIMTDFLDPSKFDEEKVSNASKELEFFTGKIFVLLDVKFEKTTELERQVIAAFCFGAINAVIHRDDLSQPQAHALIISLLINQFNYSETQAVAFAEDLIKATNKEHHPVMNSIIHRGIDGHYQYEGKDFENLKKNILEVINVVKKKA
ncbi:Imm48 family immunity protein [Paenibacillus sp. KS-LC4]|uniref:Imm48 family immunity protein n=1 Tax=Paenibacillus sp. KS-LC4 TaxID=2979727 RepID=UPI0030D081C3